MKTKIAAEIILAVTVIALTLPCNQAAAVQTTGAFNPVTLFSSQPYVTKNTKAQNFNDSITLQPGQENLPMMLIVNNGSPSGRPYSWFRLQINGEMIATEKDLKGNRAEIDVTGRMFPGTCQVICEAAGEPGASLTWSVITNPIIVNYVSPQSVMPGDQVSLTGLNFSVTSSQDTVYFNANQGQVVTAAARSITAQVPADAQKGNNQVTVIVNGLRSNPLALKVGAYPTPALVSLNYMELPPGELLTIRGENFAENATDNHVFFGNEEAQIVASSPTKITCVAPQWSFGPQSMNIPVRVIAHGITSSNALPVDLGNLFISPTLPPMLGDASR